jgi:hypothetical protein
VCHYKVLKTLSYAKVLFELQFSNIDSNVELKSEGTLQNSELYLLNPQQSPQMDIAVFQ